RGSKPLPTPPVVPEDPPLPPNKETTKAPPPPAKNEYSIASPPPKKENTILTSFENFGKLFTISRGFKSSKQQVEEASAPEMTISAPWVPGKEPAPPPPQMSAEDEAKISRGQDAAKLVIKTRVVKKAVSSFLGSPSLEVFPPSKELNPLSPVLDSPQSPYTSSAKTANNRNSYLRRSNSNPELLKGEVGFKDRVSHISPDHQSPGPKSPLRPLKSAMKPGRRPRNSEIERTKQRLLDSTSFTETSDSETDTETTRSPRTGQQRAATIGSPVADRNARRYILVRATIDREHTIVVAISRDSTLDTLKSKIEDKLQSMTDFRHDLVPEGIPNPDSCVPFVENLRWKDSDMEIVMVGDDEDWELCVEESGDGKVTLLVELGWR
ncbi:hypothetical protein HDV05_006340, partial [Chytridiales sp. JEL 0842]